MISIIFPCLNEANNDFFKKALQTYSKLENIELICVDGQSTDDTLNILKNYPVKILSLPNSSRAARLNLGLQYAQGQMIILHHPRSILDLAGIEHLRTLIGQKYIWGGFRHAFDQKGLLYAFTSWYSNAIRLKLKNIVYLDHCIFLSQDFCQHMPLLEDVKIFEDTLLSKKLNQFSRPILWPYEILTSHIRFKKNGFLKQAMINQMAKILFWCKVSPNSIDAIYEKNLNLNSKNKD